MFGSDDDGEEEYVELSANMKHRLCYKQFEFADHLDDAEVHDVLARLRQPKILCREPPEPIDEMVSLQSLRIGTWQPTGMPELTIDWARGRFIFCFRAPAGETEVRAVLSAHRIAGLRVTASSFTLFTATAPLLQTLRGRAWVTLPESSPQYGPVLLAAKYYCRFDPNNMYNCRAWSTWFKRMPLLRATGALHPALADAKTVHEAAAFVAKNPCPFAVAWREERLQAEVQRHATKLGDCRAGFIDLPTQATCPHHEWAQRAAARWCLLPPFNAAWSDKDWRDYYVQREELEQKNANPKKLLSDIYGCDCEEKEEEEDEEQDMGTWLRPEQLLRVIDSNFRCLMEANPPLLKPVLHYQAYNICATAFRWRVLPKELLRLVWSFSPRSRGLSRYTVVCSAADIEDATTLETIVLTTRLYSPHGTGASVVLSYSFHLRPRWHDVEHHNVLELGFDGFPCNSKCKAINKPPEFAEPKLPFFVFGKESPGGVYTAPPAFLTHVRDHLFDRSYANEVSAGWMIQLLAAAGGACCDMEMRPMLKVLRRKIPPTPEESDRLPTSAKLLVHQLGPHYDRVEAARKATALLSGNAPNDQASDVGSVSHMTDYEYSASEAADETDHDDYDEEDEDEENDFDDDDDDDDDESDSVD
eukprot:TRINITY_DN14307_c0_g1_i1.p1 TRINITY_DN14307_c0_g1~~TRINITY_DN14307_c0_g1_i1.p1  ORF type:complete len:644 (-),score=96.95 TRINITY_DN14307_c0_g1_i1:3-1934(-)